MAYIAATLNPEILKNFPGPVRVGKKKSGSGRVAGTRQGLPMTIRSPMLVITTSAEILLESLMIKRGALPLTQRFKHSTVRFLFVPHQKGK